MATSPVSLDTPSDVVLAAPLMLGYWPDSSLCVIYVDDANHVQLIMRAECSADAVVPVPPVTAPGQSPPSAFHLAVFLGTADQDPSSWLATVDEIAATGVPLDRFVLVTRLGDDVLWTPGDAPAHDTSVMTIPAADITATAARWGLPPWQASRAAHVGDIGADTEATARVHAAVTALSPVRADQRDTVIALVGDYLRGGPLDPSTTAELLMGLTDIRVRDTVLWDLMNGESQNWPRAAEQLADVVSRAPGGWAAPAATILAILRWQLGDGSRASAAIERALAVNPEYTLAGLVDRCLASGMHPSVWRTGVTGMAREEARHGGAPAQANADRQSA